MVGARHFSVDTLGEADSLLPEGAGARSVGGHRLQRDALRAVGRDEPGGDMTDDDGTRGAGKPPGSRAPSGSASAPRPSPFSSASAVTPFGLPSLSAPRGGGAVRSIGEKLATDAATGMASLGVPIATSPGRGGFSLGLALRYASGTGNGPFGAGMQLGVPSITRKIDRGLPEYLDNSESDVFILSGAEDLVPVGEERRVEEPGRGAFRVRRYRPRVEGGFARIERWIDEATGEAHWRTTSRDNTTSIFGVSAGARVFDPEDPRRVFSWLLEETRDDRGNVVRYTYKGEDGAGIDRGQASEWNRFVRPEGGGPARAFRATAQRYLKRIEYGNRRPGDASAWCFEVVFDYGEHDDEAPAPEEARPWPVRSDPVSTYRPGFEVRTYRLCRRVLMFHHFDELGPHPRLVASTDFAYEHRAHLTKLVKVTQAGYAYDEQAGAYERATLPPLGLGYVERALRTEVRELEPASLDGMSAGVDGVAARWVDLDGEGIAGVLLPDDRGWRYKANLGGGQLAPPVLLPSLPSLATLESGVTQLTDLEGDGRLSLVRYAPPVSGYFERTEEGAWAPFRPFEMPLAINWKDRNLRFLDVDGDGIADVLVTHGDELIWYRSRGKEGFEPPRFFSLSRDQEEGPAVLFADWTEALFLADMTGDGLLDIVRVRLSDVSYWPNLGHGRFGRKVLMDNPPCVTNPERFDPRRVRLADLDGSGTADLIYPEHDGVRVYWNESGNAFSERITLALPVPQVATHVSVVDLLGSGTACVVWSSALPFDTERAIRYVDLMGGKKPHLLDRVTNGLGGETRLAYASSTSFYLRDKAEGRPWITRLPFPVHVVERVEHVDRVAGTKLVTRRRYHHGYYDGREREYRGFAYVEQWDAETIGGGAGKGLFSDVPGMVDGDLRLPPVHTKTWFHTGAWLPRERLESALARDYYRGDPEAPHVAPFVLPPDLSTAETREAARALRGSVLRQEVYAEDGSPERDAPYVVTESSYEVRLLDRARPSTRGEGHARAVFLAHAREALALQYERRPRDPRAAHTLVLEVDAWGNVLRSAAVAYPRRTPLHPEQARLWATITEATFASPAGEEGAYRVGVPLTAATSELTGLPVGHAFTVEAMRGLIASAAEIPFEGTPSGAVERRALSRSRTLYYRDDLSGPLPPGHVGTRALPYETYAQAFTPGLLARVYGNGVDAALLSSEARYVEHGGAWWAPSGRLVFAPEAFYQPLEAVDPFGGRSRVRYDAAALLAVETTDALGNTVRADNDYRVLAPKLVTDANLNRTAVAFDALGMPVRIARMGKEGAGEGDTLDDPTVRVEYDLLRYLRTGGAQPAFVHTLARELHGEDNRRWQETYSYVDGSGREGMRKVQAASGEVPVRAPDGRLLRGEDGAIQMRFEPRRWIGTGRTLFDNKGNPVKRYEPFFSDTFAYETERELVEWGVTPVLRYDPLGRLVRTDLPDGTFRRVDFDAWRQVAWDPNDTVLESRWYRDRGAPDPRGPEPRDDAPRRAAWLAAQHTDTPARAHMDSLGRTFLTEDDNRDPRGLYRTRVELDVSGNTLAVIDARGNLAASGQVFDMLGRMLFSDSADAGPARTLPDVLGCPVRGWDARGHTLRYRYDALRRPTHLFVRAMQGPELLAGCCVYGEAHSGAVARNLRTQPYQLYDGVGVATSARFDFDGNLVAASRRLARAYRETPDWSALAELEGVAAIEEAADALLERETFVTTAAYDALGRVVSRVTPDRSETRPSYDEGGLLQRVDVHVRGAPDSTAFVEAIAYNARGDRTRIVRGNGVATSYAYDPETFRLTRLISARAGEARLQDLGYTYDPVGNVVQADDRVAFGNPDVPAGGLYTYDPLYRLTSAEGREHPGQQPSFADPELVDLAHPHDLRALRRYREVYRHDPVGNLLEMAHRPLHAAAPGWVRRYDYAQESNRLLRTSGPRDDPGAPFERYAHDAAGNMTAMPHLAEMRWDFANRLAHVDREGGGHVYFAYDGGGERARKVYEHGGLVEERIYLGGFELYRKRRKGAAELAFERETLHVMDGARRVAMVETTTADEDTPTFETASRTRYDLDNHLGSAVVEVDEAGEVITYEEYLPFGGTALRAGRRGGGLGPKRYRYTGKERDEETGFYYYGARYYAAWLGRWTAVDPLGIGAGTSVYAYANGNPVIFVDPDGMEAKEIPIPDSATAEYEDPDYPYLVSGFHDEAGDRWVWSEDKGTFVQIVWAPQAPSAPPTVSPVTWQDVENAQEFEAEVRACNEHTVECSQLWPEAYQIWLWRRREQDDETRRRNASAGGISVRDQEAGEKTMLVGQIALLVLPEFEEFALGEGLEAEASLESLSVKSPNAGENVLPARIVREIHRGERFADIVKEIETRTMTTEQEHAYVVLAQDGRRVIVTGGLDGIDFRNMDLRGIALHSHPPGSLPGHSPEDIAFLEEHFQSSSWLLEVEKSRLARLSRFRVPKK
jgi:RHS repeat-associated protein